MSRLKNFSSFKFQENLINIENKKKLVAEAKFTQFQHLIEEGKKTDIVSAFLRKKSRINESYNLVLENREALDEIKLETCKETMSKGISDLKKQSLSILKKYEVSDYEISKFEQSFENLVFNRIDEKNVIQKFFAWATAPVKKVLGFLYDYVVKPGYDALRTCMVSMFGEEVVAAVERIGKAILKSLVDAFDDVVNLYGSIFDAAWKGLKSIAAGITAVIMELVEVIGKVLQQIWKLIIFPVKAMLKRAEGTGTSKLVGFIEKAGEKLTQEFNTFSEHWSALKKKLWEKAWASKAKENLENGAQKILDTAQSQEDDDEESGENTQKEKEKTKDSQNESFGYVELISYSLIGTVNRNQMNFEDVIDFYNKPNFVNEGSEVKKPHSEGYVKKWIIGTVTFILSPITKCVEIITENLSKAVIALPGWIAGVGKYLAILKTFVYMPLLIAVVAGLVGDALSVTGGIANYIKHPEGHSPEIKGLLDYVTKPIEHAKHNIEKGLEIVGGTKAVAAAVGGDHAHLFVSDDKMSNLNIPEKKKHVRTNFEEFINEDAKVVIGGEKDVIEKHKDRYAGLMAIATTASSAMIGFMMSIFMTTFPVAHIVFECLSIVVLSICLLGVIGETTDIGKKVVPKSIVSAYHFIHGSH